MFETWKKLRYGARVLLSAQNGEVETIDVAGRATSIRRGGAGPIFVYLHSTLGESSRWLPFHQAWARQFTVVAPSHPGFGKSAGFEHVDNVEDMAFHYLELFDALGFEQVILGGVSLGGWIAAEFACRWPERVHKLWLSGAPGLWVPEEPLPDLFRNVQSKTWLRQAMFHDPAGYMARLVIPDEAKEEQMISAYQGLTVLARLLWERPYDPKLAARLHRVHCPTLLLWGAADRLVPPSYGEAYRRALPQAQLQVLADCGHLGMFEKEEEFVQAVAQFALA